jgi:hypothetical protein
MHPLGLQFFGHFPSVPAALLALQQKASNSLEAFPKELPIHFGYCSNGYKELLAAFLNVSWDRFGNLLYICLKAVCFCILRLKIEDTTEKF